MGAQADRGRWKCRQIAPTGAVLFGNRMDGSALGGRDFADRKATFMAQLNKKFGPANRILPKLILTFFNNYVYYSMFVSVNV